MTAPKVVLASLSAAMDGGFTAIADVCQAMMSAGAEADYRLIGGVTVMLHIQRLRLALPLRATGDADFGVPPHVRRRPNLRTGRPARPTTRGDGRSTRQLPMALSRVRRLSSIHAAARARQETPHSTGNPSAAGLTVSGPTP